MLSDSLLRADERLPLAAWRFDHVGVIVKSLNVGVAALEAMLGVQEWTSPLEDEVNGVHIVFGRDPSGLVHELLAPIDERSPVYRALKSRANLLNHIAYLVPALDEAETHLRSAGCMPTDVPRQAIAYGNAPIQFFVSPLDTVIEIIAAPAHLHSFGSTPFAQGK